MRRESVLKTVSQALNPGPVASCPLCRPICALPKLTILEKALRRSCRDSDNTLVFLFAGHVFGLLQPFSIALELHFAHIDTWPSSAMALSMLVSLATVAAALAGSASTIQESKGSCALQTKMQKDGASKFITCTSDEMMCHDPATMTDSCHPMSAGCPVTCPAGEHVCHSPASCPGCSAYNWCSSHSCPVYCAADEVVCHDSATMTDSCHPASTGCPLTCPPGDQVCHMPPSCPTCHDGHSFCSPSCPVYCAADELVCHDYATMTDSCHPMSAGCPVTCPAGEHMCHTPASCPGCSGSNWCSPSTCPVYCAVDEVVCHDSATMTDSCHPASTGCPITCPAGDQMCLAPDGHSFCSPSCPVYCAPNELMCHDPATMTDSCHPMSAGCPVTCPAGEHTCHTPPSCDICSGSNWCSPGTCPVYCAVDEVVCHDSATMTDSCHPASTGCPITCAPGDQVCHTPPSCPTCHDGSSFCSSTPTCPVYCAADEVVCHDSATMTDSCHPASTGCPITCLAGDQVCHMPPSCPTCNDGHSFCSPSCPVYCAPHELMCHDATTMTDSCHPMSAGCPVTCPAGEHVCHMPAPCDGCSGSNWCSSHTCPVYCAADEVVCHDSATMTDSCHPASTGCPITCPAGDQVCHSPPSCPTCNDGYSFCSPSCPVYCGPDELVCHDYATMTDSCHPMSAGCPVTCPAGEHVCHTPASCPGCSGSNWCSSYTCPVYCAVDELICHDSTTMTDSCHPKSTGCPVTCLAGEHVCHSPPTCEFCDGYNWCSSYTCPVTCGIDEIVCHDPMTMTDSCHPSSAGCP